MATYIAPESLHVGNGVETVFGFTFPYLRPADLAVTVNGLATSWVLVGTAQVSINPAPANGARVRIYRNTPAQFPGHLFSTGVPMLPRYIDENNRQLLYALQEGLLQFAQTEAKAAEALATANRALLASAAAAESAAQQARDMARTVRVPTTDPVINPLPDATTRANKIMAFNAVGQPIVVLPSSGSASDVMIELAKPAGAGYIGWERAPRTPLGTGVAGYLNNSSISLWEPRFVRLAVKPNPMDPTTWDWAPAIQGAIDYIIDLARAANTTYGLPRLIVPAYFYNLSAGVRTTPWVKLTFEGNSVWDFAQAPHGVTYVTISSTSLVVTADKFASIGACMEGSAGGLLIQGRGPMETNSSIAIFVGNSASGQSVVRDVQLRDISVRNCYKALEFGKFGTYLFTMTGGRLEHNFYGIVTPQGLVTNSGERMVFDKVIIGGSGIGGAAVLHRCDTFDLFFKNCSFDFNHDILRMDTGVGYASIVCDTCHFEGWDGYLVNWNATGGANFYVTLNSCTLLPTTYRTPSPLVLNSASRPLVRFGGTGFSRVDVRINNPVIRFTHNPWTEDPFLAEYVAYTPDPAGRKSVRITGYDPYSFNAFGTQLTVANLDYTFQQDATGTEVTAMSCWERAVNANAVSAAKLDTVAGKKVLVLTGTAISSYYYLRAKQFYPVTPGQTAYTWAAVSLAGLTMPPDANADLPNVQLGVDMQYADGRVVRGVSSTVNMGRVFNDTTVPNFAEGRTRYISTGSFGFQIPQGVVAVKPYLGFTNFVGDLYVSRGGLWLQ